MLSTDVRVLLGLLLTAWPLSRAPAQAISEIQSHAVSVPDSVRSKVGYQHWKGAAIGGFVGAAAGLLLGLVPAGACDDCTSPKGDTGEVLKAGLVGAGLGGTLGLLIGAASPRYEWLPRGLDDPVPPPPPASAPLRLRSVQVPRGDYRYEGLAIGGIPLAAFGAYLGSQLRSACPTVPGADCRQGSLGNAVTLGLVGGAIGGGVGYLIGRLSPKEPREPAR